MAVMLILAIVFCVLGIAMAFPGSPIPGPATMVLGIGLLFTILHLAGGSI